MFGHNGLRRIVGVDDGLAMLAVLLFFQRRQEILVLLQHGGARRDPERIEVPEHGYHRVDSLRCITRHLLCLLPLRCAAALDNGMQADSRVAVAFKF